MTDLILFVGALAFAVYMLVDSARERRQAELLRAQTPKPAPPRAQAGPAPAVPVVMLQVWPINARGEAAPTFRDFEQIWALGLEAYVEANPGKDFVVHSVFQCPQTRRCAVFVREA